MHTITIFSNLARLISRHEFAAIQENYNGPKLRATNRWSQFMALAMSQIFGLNILRDINKAMTAKKNKMYHISAAPIARSTLSRLNEQQNYHLYQ